MLKCLVVVLGPVPRICLRVSITENDVNNAMSFSQVFDGALVDPRDKTEDDDRAA